MSDTTENTNELDSYGVWVKNNNQKGETDDLNFADSLDLPDFEESDNIEESDFSDMFKEDDTINLDPSSDDTTLTDDELMNITSGDGIQIEETAAEDNSDIDDISFDSLEENSVSDADLSSFEDVSIEEAAPEAEEELATEDFTFEDTDAPAATEETVVEEAADDAAVEEMDIEDFGVESSDQASDSEEEISLDDFMDSGFSDESVASGNNGFAADALPAAGDSEEVSLDDFVDMSEFGMEEEAPKKEETITDEKPLDMDINFDSSADTIQTEENDSEAYSEDEGFQEDEFTAASETEAAPEENSTGDDIESEEVDLADFGIDANAEETPVTQDVEGEKNKEAVVDYDLSVGDGNMNAAPVVNEIKSTAPVEDFAEVEEIQEAETVENVASVDNSLLQQIVDDLSNLKEEINTLKINLEEMKTSPAPAADSGVISEEIAIDDPSLEDDSSKEDTGFFSGDDGDDTIALSTDELSNILNTADFSQDEVTEAPAEEEVDDFAVEDTPAEEAAEEAPAFEEDIEVGEEIAQDSLGAISDKTSDISFDFEEENLSEPNLDDIEIDEEALEDDLPEEIEISKDDDILVESSSSDFMDSVQDTTDEHQPEEGVVEEAEDDTFSTVDNVFDEETPAVEETIVEEETPFVEETVVEEEIPLVEETVVEEETPLVEETIEEEAAEEDQPVVVEEPVIEDETFVEEPVDEAPAANAFIDNDFVSHEDDNNELTDSNIDYLTTEEDKAEENVDDNAELKKDIKSVLLYMDQLLENLPEEKIVEFAKSDEFTTYKKLFSELGLS